jgi:hypothetical protein
LKGKKKEKDNAGAQRMQKLAEKRQRIRDRLGGLSLWAEMLG